MTSAFMAIRLSHETDESTSPKRQTEQTQGYCDLRGWDIAHVASNLDVSGGISPWERPDLGKWLTEPELIARWDVLVVASARLDRLTRSYFDAASSWRLPRIKEGWVGEMWNERAANSLC
jgi:site-specific DNA recombinase